MIEHNIDNFSNLNLGLQPYQIVDLKGLMGDSSDNLPGIRGIGEKGAIKLLSEFGSLEKIILNKDTLSTSFIKKIEEGKEMGILCKKIAKIMDDGDFIIPFETTSINKVDMFELVRFLNINSIHSLAERIKEK